jgi:acyl carrier protein
MEILSEYVRSEVGFKGRIDPDVDLLEAKVLDSFSIVQLAVFIQEEFDVELEAEDLTRENLSSLARMVSLIDKRKTGG